MKGLCKSEGDRCDLPVLLVNTPFYGGLGDEIPIVSSSPTSGRTSFLHEIGHALGDFGEEYDAGADYSGANFALTKRPCRHNERSRKNEAGHDVWPCVSWTKHVSPSFTSESSALVLAEWCVISLFLCILLYTFTHIFFCEQALDQFETTFRESNRS